MDGSSITNNGDTTAEADQPNRAGRELMATETAVTESYQPSAAEPADAAGSDDEYAADSAAKPSAAEKSMNLPLSKIKLIMKTDPDVSICSADSAFLITKSAELFIKYLTEEAYKSTKSANRKTMQKRDVDDAVLAVDQFLFLDGVL